jgi:L-amino acid N-acyltransferase YncA
MIRIATAADAAGILEIYAPFIQNTSLTFETEVPGIDAFSQRIQSYLKEWPWLVMEVNGRIAGYAYASRYRERTAYQWSVECSVYIHPEYTRRGFASKLYSCLFEFLKLQGFTTVYAVINLPNDNSVALHEQLGFEWFATYEKVGYKLGRWKNVGWWRLPLNEFSDEPAAPTAFAKLDQAAITKLLSSTNE